MKLYVADTAYRFRWLVLAAWAILLIVVLSWIIELAVEYWAWPSLGREFYLLPATALRLSDPYWANILFPDGLDSWDIINFPLSVGVVLFLLVAGFILLLAYSFLPTKTERQSQLPAQRPLSWRARLAVSLMAAMLSLGLIAAALSYLQSWHDVTIWLRSNELVSRAGRVSPPAGSYILTGAVMAVPTAVYAALGLAWHACLTMFRKTRQCYWQAERMTLYLCLASIVLLAAGVITGARARRIIRWMDIGGVQLAMMIGWLVLLWAWGCRIRLLFLLERYKQTPDTLCFACGYDLRGTLAAARTQCPECGATARQTPPCSAGH